MNPLIAALREQREAYADAAAKLAADLACAHQRIAELEAQLKPPPPPADPPPTAA